MLKIFNSLTKKAQKFIPLQKEYVGMYTCGPTVYDYAHIGHARKYVNDDLIKRALLYLGYKVKHVMNITDVGHMVSDADTGEDKMEKGAKASGRNVWEVAEYFTKDFLEMTDSLNIIRPDVLCRATDHIKEQIDQIKLLEQKGFAYDTQEAVYFDTSKFKRYFNIFGGQKAKEKIVSAREEVNTGEHKKNPADFVLWFKRVGRYENHVMHWDSPWGDGFPGWHIECSAMSSKYLGEQFDIHTGGIDHLTVHHPNEIAQSECAFGKSPFVKYWIHHNFLLVNSEKMSKSKGNFYRLLDLKAKGYSPMHLRYYFLNTHYRKPLNFTFKGLDNCANTYNKLMKIICDINENISNQANLTNKLKASDKFSKLLDNEFKKAIEDDFNFPLALSIFWKVLKSETANPTSKMYLVLKFDQVFGLGIESLISQPKGFIEGCLNQEVLQLINKRNQARKSKDWKTADEIREILKSTYQIEIEDLPNGKSKIKFL